MGQCMARRKLADGDSIIARVERMILHNDLLDLDFSTKTDEFRKVFLDINEGLFKVLDFRFDMLTLAAYHGASDCFIYIHKNFKVSLAMTESLLIDQGTSLIDIICTRGNTEILDYYLPYFSPKNLQTSFEELTFSLNLSNNADEDREKVQKKGLSTHTAVHKACEQGNINVLSYIHRYYEQRSPAPVQLDIEHQDEVTGENCALIACRRANYTMIKFLHSTCKSNFRVLNKQGENAIQILAATQQRTPVKDFHEIFVYLVSQVGVDLFYNYEETLVLVSCKKTLKFIEKRFKEKGITFDKSQIEAKCQLFKVDHMLNSVEKKIDRLSRQDLGFCSIYTEVMEQEDDISVIGPHKETPFSSILDQEAI